MAKETKANHNPYWLVRLKTQDLLPYLVGSYDRVAEEISRYVGGRFSDVHLGHPAHQEELRPRNSFQQACKAGISRPRSAAAAQ